MTEMRRDALHSCLVVWYNNVWVSDWYKMYYERYYTWLRFLHTSVVVLEVVFVCRCDKAAFILQQKQF